MNYPEKEAISQESLNEIFATGKWGGLWVRRCDAIDDYGRLAFQIEACDPQTGEERIVTAYLVEENIAARWPVEGGQ